MSHTAPRHRVPFVPLALVALLSASGAALGQNSLGDGQGLRRPQSTLDPNPYRGDGQALDRVLQRNAGFANPASRNMRVEAATRNAIVTGNVAGGAAFRGSLGYSGALDFRGATATDDLFRFQRDSFYSGLAARGVRGIDALRAQMELTTVGGGVVLQRPSAGSSGSTLSGSSIRFIDPSRSGTLRSTARFEAGRASEPMTFELPMQDGSRVRMGLSSLRGLYAEPARSPLDELLDRQRGRVAGRSPDTPTSPVALGSEAAPGSGTGEGETGPMSRLGGPAQPTPIDARLASTSLSHRRVVEDLQARREERRAAAPGTERDGLREPTPTTEPGAPSQPGLEPGAAPAERPEETEGEGRRQEGPSTGEAPAQRAAEFLVRLDRLRTRLITGSSEEEGDLRSVSERAADAEREEEDGDVASTARDLFGGERPVIDRLAELAPATESAADAQFGRHMEEGQRSLQSGRWFDAEESFTRALTVREGDAMASIGRVHAQLGAGMFLSAATNLKNLFRAHPELVPVIYDPILLPREQRMGDLIGALRDSSERNDTFGRDAGLLLSYVGRQTASAELVERGFRAVQRVDEYLELEPDDLTTMLRAVWQAP